MTVGPTTTADDTGTDHRVAVVGSANLDLIAHTGVLPAPGETVLADDYDEAAGGKGLNQAIGAARVTPTVLVAVVGNDTAGSTLRHAAHSRSVDVSLLATVDAPSGRALIAVDSGAENMIVVVPGANHLLTAAHVASSLERAQPTVVLAQSEVPNSAVSEAARWSSTHGARFVWNCSPAGNSDLGLLEHADPLVVNHGEALAVLRALGISVSTPTEALTALAERCRSVVITLGSEGAVGRSDGSMVNVDAQPPSAVADTTGAGDEFAGALAGALARGAALSDAMELASAAAARLIAQHRHSR